jgi:hypothetical protein
VQARRWRETRRIGEIVMANRSLFAAAAASALLATLAAADAGAQSTSGCDRACLEGFMDRYVAAQASNDASGLPFTNDVKITENGVEMRPGEGFFTTADEPTYKLAIADPEMGGTAALLVVREGDHSVFELIRLKVADGMIAEVETIIAREGESGPMFVPDFATEPRREFTLSIREAERNSRLELMAVADAYWRALETNGWPEYHPAPLLPGVVRIENGLATTNGSSGLDQGGVTPSGGDRSSAPEQFNMGLFRSRTIYDRRFPVVDLERGVVLSIARMGLKPDEGFETPPHWKGGNPVLGELFAVQDGKIIAIEVVMNSTIPVDRTMVWPREPLTRSVADP